MSALMCTLLGYTSLYIPTTIDYIIGFLSCLWAVREIHIDCHAGLCALHEVSGYVQWCGELRPI